MLRLIVTLFFIAGLARLSAQHPYFYTINDENGLPSNEVYTVVQDSAGFMWIGCEAGLYRYDGFTFKSYTNPRQNGKAISSLQFDSKGKLWCQNFAGQVYTVEQDSLIIYADVQARMTGHPAFDVDDAQNLYIGLPEGILKIAPGGTETLLFAGVFFASELKWLGQDRFFVYGENRIFYMTEGDKVSKHASLPGEIHPDVVWIDKRSEKNHVLFSNNTEQRFKAADLFEPLPQGVNDFIAATIPPQDVFYTLYTFPGDETWVTTSSGAYAVKTKQQLFKGEKISNVFLDREGNYWFTSLENGIYVVPDVAMKILDKKNSLLTDQNITSLCAKDENSLLIGTFSGSLFELDLRTGQLQRLPQNASTRYRSVSAILKDEYGILASRSNLSRFDDDFLTEKAFSYHYLRDLCLANERLYFTATVGSGYFNYNCPDFETMVKGMTLLSPGSGKFVEHDAVHNRTWFAQSEGLAFLAGDSLRFFYDRGQKIYPTCMAASGDLLLLGTIDNGVVCIRDTTICARLNPSNILRGKFVSAIFVNEHYILVSTEVCVNVIDRQKRTVDFLDLTDGINTKDINVILADKVNFYLGSTKGLYIVPQQSDRLNNVSPVVSITGVYVNDKKPGELPLLELNYRDELRVDFSVAALRSRGLLSFRYKISEEETQWSRLSGNLRQLTFSSLPAGSYHLELYALNEDGFASAVPAELYFVVHAPFWQKWWFYLLISLFTVVFVALMYTLRIRSIRRKALLKEQLIRSQLGTIKAQMNPHFIFNALNSIQDLILQQDVQNSYRYLNKFSQLMRKVLEASERDEITLAEEISFLQLYLGLEKLRFGDDFTYTISSDPSVDVMACNIPPMLLQPFVENAVKHGLLHKKGVKVLTISFLPVDDGILCIVADNGIGRAHAREIRERRQSGHKSFATSAAEHRAELLSDRGNYTCKIETIDLMITDQPAGTEVRILITAARDN